MVIVAKHSPEEFRCDVVSVARKYEAPLNQIAKDFGVGNGTLSNWLKRAEVEDGVQPGLKQADAAELWELKKRNRLLEQENENTNGLLRQHFPRGIDLARSSAEDLEAVAHALTAG
jgi:transposase